MDLLTVVVTVLVCLFGSGGIVIWVLNRMAKKHDAKDSSAKDLKELKLAVQTLQRGLIMCLENDCVIFHALKTHQINGDSEMQENKMKAYFLSLLEERK
ncbi:MAG: hypothetical protein J5891_02340 [Spirochaetales bacterium]|nr:hypothetical protein [Spirochaetales bacterium]